MSAVQPSSDLAFERWPNCLTCLAEQGVRGPGGFDGMRKRMEAAAGREMPFSEAGALGRTAASGGLWPIAGLGMKFLFVLVVVVLGGVRGLAATKTWNGTGDWFLDVGNWSGGVPADGDDAVVASGTVTLTSSTPSLASFTLNGGTVIASNWLTAIRATDVWLNNGTLTCAGPFSGTETSNRVYIVCSNLTLAAAASINVAGKGYRAQEGPGASDAPDRGASHGGKGRYSIKQPYGSLEYPETPGSGGWNEAYGASGGGVVRISASGTVVINGMINADGGYGYQGGPSGGSVLIECHSFAGAGTLSARAIDQAHGTAGGGGGRIAVHYSEIGDPVPTSMTFNVLGMGLSLGFFRDPVPLLNGEMGTVWLSDTNFVLQQTMNRLGGFLHVPGFTAWSVADLTVNDLAVGLPSNFALTVGNSLVINGNSAGLELAAGATLACGGTITVARTSGFFDGAQLVLDESNLVTVAGDLMVNNGIVWTRRPQGFLCNGDFSLTNASRLWVYSAPTNGTGPEYGTLIEVGGTFAVQSDAVVNVFCDSFNGGGALFRVGACNVAAGGKVDSVGRGYAVNYGPGAGGYIQGGAHGGHGGLNPLLPYGSVQMPTAAGSGGGNNPPDATPGGGLIWVDALPSGTVTVDGVLDASGPFDYNHYSGKGAGGSILVRCHTLRGSGMLRAAGGYSSAVGTAGGGGGRIAVAYVASSFAGIMEVPGGVGDWASGKTGTIFRCHSPVANATFADGPAPWMETRLSRDSDDIVIDRLVSQWNGLKRLQWTDTSRDGLGNEIPNVVTYIVRGLVPSSPAAAYVDDVRVPGIRAASEDGTLTLSGVTLSPSVTVRIELGLKGTVFLMR